ncbi:MAG: hypothetical protein WB556_21605 [Candidatus Acidiferrum sp.]
MIKKLGISLFLVLLEEVPVPGVDGPPAEGAAGVLAGGADGSWVANVIEE